MSRFLAIDETAKVLKNGDVIHTSRRGTTWTFRSVTHPRKVFVTDKEDPNGPDSWPNMESREFYANLFDLGIWDTDREEWTFAPDWDKETIADIEHILRKKD